MPFLDYDLCMYWLLCAVTGRSVFGQHVAGFKDHFDTEFESLANGDELGKFRQGILKAYKQHKNNLKSAKPTKRSTYEEHELYYDAYDLVYI